MSEEEKKPNLRDLLESTLKVNEAEGHVGTPTIHEPDGGPVGTPPPEQDAAMQPTAENVRVDLQRLVDRATDEELLMIWKQISDVGVENVDIATQPGKRPHKSDAVRHSDNWKTRTLPAEESKVIEDFDTQYQKDRDAAKDYKVGPPFEEGDPGEAQSDDDAFDRLEAWADENNDLDNIFNSLSLLADMLEGRGNDRQAIAEWLMNKLEQHLTGL